MAANKEPIFGLIPQSSGTTFANADGVTPKAIYTAGGNGSKVLGIGVVTSETVNNNFGLFLNPGGGVTSFPITAKAIPALSGFLAANPKPSVSLLDTTQMPQILSDGSFQLAPGDVLSTAPLTAVAATKAVTITVQAIDY